MFWRYLSKNAANSPTTPYRDFPNCRNFHAFHDRTLHSTIWCMALGCCTIWATGALTSTLGVRAKSELCARRVVQTRYFFANLAKYSHRARLLVAGG